MKKILITGASGFVGSFLVELALERGYEVYAGIRKTSSRKYLLDERIKFVEIDFSNEISIASSIRQYHFDFIIQNAGVTKANKEDAYYKVNAEALDNFVHVLKGEDKVPERFIYISSLAAFGPADNSPEGIVSNVMKPNPVTIYGKSKYKGELLLKEHQDFPYTIVRPTAVYGPRELDLLTVYKMLNSRIELLIGTVPQKLTFIYVKDLVRVILDLLSIESMRQEYFVTDGNTYTAEEFNNEVKTQLQKTALKLKLPVSLVRILAFFTEKISSLSGNYPALNLEKVNELECLNWECDITNLRQEINFSPEYSLEQGIKETIKWYKDHNVL